MLDDKLDEGELETLGRLLLVEEVGIGLEDGSSVVLVEELCAAIEDRLEENLMNELNDAADDRLEEELADELNNTTDDRLEEELVDELVDGLADGLADEFNDTADDRLEEELTDELDDATDTADVWVEEKLKDSDIDVLVGTELEVSAVLEDIAKLDGVVESEVELSATDKLVGLPVEKPMSELELLDWATEEITGELVGSPMLELEDRPIDELTERLESVVVIALASKSVDELANEDSTEGELIVVRFEPDFEGVVGGLYSELLVSALTTSLEGNSDDVELAVESDVANELEVDIPVNVADEMSEEMPLSDVSRLVDDEMYESEVVIELEGVGVAELNARELSSKVLTDEEGDE